MILYLKFEKQNLFECDQGFEPEFEFDESLSYKTFENYFECN